MDNYSQFNRSEPLVYVSRKAIVFYHDSPSLTEEENKAFKHLLELNLISLRLAREEYDYLGNLNPTTIICHTKERYGKTVLNFLKYIAPKLSSVGFGLSLIEPDPTHTRIVDGHVFKDVKLSSFSTEASLSSEINHTSARDVVVTFELQYAHSLNSIQARQELQDTLDSVKVEPVVAKPIKPVVQKNTVKKNTVRKLTPIKIPKKTK